MAAPAWGMDWRKHQFTRSRNIPRRERIDLAATARRSISSGELDGPAGAAATPGVMMLGVALPTKPWGGPATIGLATWKFRSAIRRESCTCMPIVTYLLS